MLDIQMQSVDASSGNMGLQRSLVQLFVRSAAMGVMTHRRLTKLDPEAVGMLLDELGRSGLLRSATVNLTPLLRKAATDLDVATAERMIVEVQKVSDALNESPSPSTEWAAMRETLGDALLAALVGVSDASLRRYAIGGRETPQKVAERLHWVAMVVGDLAGSYNSFGIRRWFDRPRSQLGGKSPRSALGDGWGVDDPQAVKVRSLAEALVGPNPLAA